jgi:hypothetical protein
MAQLLSNLPIGAKIKFGKHQVNTETALPIIWVVADKNHSGYPANSVTLITEKIIDLRAYDAKEPYDDEDLLRGNNDYRLSNIHQWLNSSASANGWYIASHGTDTPPTVDNTRYGTQYQTRPGFLYNFTQTERNSIMSTTLTTQKGSDVSKSVTAKIFLPSLWETLGTNNWVDGSSQLAYFKSTSVKCGLTDQAFDNTLSTSKPTVITESWEYLTRSTSPTNVSKITATGGEESDYPNDGNSGVRPLLNISASSKISDTVDSDGCYTVLPQTAPVISGSNSNLGTIENGFSQTYTVTDADNEPVTVKEYVDNELVRSYVATLGADNSIEMKGVTWLKLTNGVHTIKIVATDGFDEVTRTYTFTKSLSSFVVQRATPITASKEPKSIRVTVVKVIPEGATFKVEACRNGFDTTPYWEDITRKVESSGIHDFDLTHTKSATEWGINVRVTVDRNGKSGACYITEIGGNFE